MKPVNFLNNFRFKFLIFDLIFLTIAIVLLAQPNFVQPITSERAQNPQASQLENVQKPRWLVFATVAGVVGCIGLVALRQKHQAAMRKNPDSKENTAAEDTYFG
ncbi:hypothetical protein IQ264_04050 [Phormidium sp. LEGE 05292]|uniref:hypothetical protein n=1 Tax=[Phormidium] sp. LEGE 05292 TaxID=767427 RepID=UPI00187EC35A|nr:hypothetical protein [Phormidium sp. LEGE 05292]MBE9224643.1 hypothetical protein [Phormidium sp. LEGE 05292]